MPYLERGAATVSRRKCERKRNNARLRHGKIHLLSDCIAMVHIRVYGQRYKTVDVLSSWLWTVHQTQFQLPSTTHKTLQLLSTLLLLLLLVPSLLLLLALTALSLTHPVLGETITFRVKLPKSFSPHTNLLIFLQMHHKASDIWKCAVHLDSNW